MRSHNGVFLEGPSLITRNILISLTRWTRMHSFWAGGRRDNVDSCVSFIFIFNFTPLHLTISPGDLLDSFPLLIGAISASKTNSHLLYNSAESY